MKYYFLHPETLKVCTIHNGRSLWEDHANKAEFVVVKEVGPAMDHYREAMSEPLLDRDALEAMYSVLQGKGYPENKIKAIVATLNAPVHFLERINQLQIALRNAIVTIEQANELVEFDNDEEKEYALEYVEGLKRVLKGQK